MTNKNWTKKDVEEHFEEAVYTLKKLPDFKVPGYFSTWPEIEYTPQERMRQMKFPAKLHATPEQVTRLEQTFDWMLWITVEERKLIWKRAMRVRWKTICWELGCDRTTAWRKWSIGLEKIASRLSA
jgi:hypothetical protein